MQTPFIHVYMGIYIASVVCISHHKLLKILITNGLVQTNKYVCMHACGIILCMNASLKYEKVQLLFVLKYFIPCQRCNTH